MALAARADLEARYDRRTTAYAYALDALALRERALGPNHLEVADVLMLAAVNTPFDRVDAGLALARRALEVRLAELGADHPDVADAWARVGQLHRDRFEHGRELEGGARQRARRRRSR